MMSWNAVEIKDTRRWIRKIFAWQLTLHNFKETLDKEVLNL